MPGYRVLGRLGRGGMGVVYKAIHLALNRPVALKMLGRNAYELDPETPARFRKEAEALASLRHPNIVPVYEVGEVNGLPFFTMELVDGGDLATRIRIHPPGPAEAARIATQLARRASRPRCGHLAPRFEAQQHLDECGWRSSERGLQLDQPAGGTSAVTSPEGLLVPKIADFGLAKRSARPAATTRTMTQAGDILGTPSYMAPEQAKGMAPGPSGHRPTSMPWRHSV